MAIEGFDYKEFAQMMSSQAGELVPANFNAMQKDYVVKTLTNFTLLAGEAISNDEKLNFNADQAVFITQIIAEWSFHKSIDLVHSGIMPEHWDSVMQKIAFTIFEIAKQAIQKDIPQDKTLQLIEHHVDKTYKEAIEDLEKRGIITKEISTQAANQSNIDEMAKQVQEQEEAQKAAAVQVQEQYEQPAESAPSNLPAYNNTSTGVSADRSMKMKSLAMVLKLLDKKRAEEVLSRFSEETVNELRNLIKTPRLEEQVNMVVAKQTLDELKLILPKKKKLSQDNMVREMDKVFQEHQMEDIEMAVKSERPFVKRFVSQSYEGDYYQGIPLRVAKLLVNYVKENAKKEEDSQ